MKLIALFVALSLAGQAANAQTRPTQIPAKEIAPPGTARGLVDACDVMLEAVDRNFRQLPTPEDEGAYFTAGGYCMGYLEGFRNGYMVSSIQSGKTNICLPNGVTLEQIARILSKRLEQSPEMEHLPQFGFVSVVLAATWPCEG